jgi:nucleoid DNA-binding protein
MAERYQRGRMDGPKRRWTKKPRKNRPFLVASSRISDKTRVSGGRARFAGPHDETNWSFRMAKKTSSKKTSKKTTRKTTASTAPRKTAKITPAKEKPRTKSEVVGTIADQVGISKKEVQSVFDTMGEMIAADLKKNAVGTFNVPGMMKVTVQRKPATKARKGINPFTGEETTFKAKPARNVVKVRPLKGLKDRVG